MNHRSNFHLQENYTPDSLLIANFCNAKKILEGCNTPQTPHY